MAGLALPFYPRAPSSPDLFPDKERDMKKTLRTVSSTLALLALFGCGGGGSSPTAPLPSAALTLAANPTSATGEPCTVCGPLVGEKRVTTDLTARESAGVGVVATELAMQLRLDSGELLVDAGYNGSGLTQLAGTTRIAAGGQLLLPDAGPHYPGARAGETGNLTYTLRGTDDNGHAVSATVVVRVTT
jgi:hypothetical protein